jgi:excisionase family DNA binding protein
VTIVTTGEAAQRLGVPPQDLYRLIAENKLQAAKNDRGRIVVDLHNAREALGFADQPSDDPLAAVEEASRDAQDALDRRDRAILAAYQADPTASLSRLSRAANLSVETVRRIIQRQGGELRRVGRPGKPDE